jgi:ribose-phosphate pyrophosphokinase
LTNSDAVCYPDKGALEKHKLLYLDFPYMYGEKVRDQQSGRIISYAVKQSNNYEAQIGDRILIVDDICDGGATFVLLAHKLLELGIKEVNLFVTHGIFSKGLRPLYDAGIKRIFTQDGEASQDLYANHLPITYRRL